VPIGRAAIARAGRNVTIVAVSHMVLEALDAAQRLEADGVSAEVVDLRSVRPLDSDLVAESVRRTGRLVVADTGWRSFGVGAEVAARIGEACFGGLKAPIRRVALPDVPTPCSSALEKVYYPGAQEIADAVRSTLGRHDGANDSPTVSTDSRGGFSGPF
jgi:pyruvate dehydrogenase E1 component beta subunit